MRYAEPEEYFEHLEQSEKHKVKLRTQVANSKTYLPKFLTSNKVFYDFSQGLELDVGEVMAAVLEIAKKFNVKCAFIESVANMMVQMIRLRDQVIRQGRTTPRTLFQTKFNKNEFLRIDLVRGIPPSKNMMNYPPFYPKPKPTPPTQTSGSFAPVNTTDLDSNSVNSRKRGREEPTYGEDQLCDTQELALQTSNKPQLEKLLPAVNILENGRGPGGPSMLSPPNLRNAATPSIAPTPILPGAASILSKPAPFGPLPTLPPPLMITGRPSLEINKLHPLQPPYPIPPSLSSSVLRDGFGNTFLYSPNGYITPMGAIPAPNGYPPLIRCPPGPIPICHVPAPPPHDKVRETQMQVDTRLGSNQANSHRHINTAAKTMVQSSNRIRSNLQWKNKYK
ncbi:uncharacterized protein CANTADRAFT_27190 [Suhomyces tanzawaensis NRRL Y-17324]|uniref:Uncharacterized protein n=1 Tax=Suhomyces tanzawaensis NRRL Y-17324 TaxID=984487 RepID=A0A1E4SD50_9ASCO|nr:uncharacterized protein CANTADRAFT_27190 [Suhomyces tanzawaensis NRRL Y-17324]ODV77312.1 hypothetical protein CANTADRAFT_27190 [Suhomyces tanzawaensis NRRL Y-17324]